MKVTSLPVLINAMEPLLTVYRRSTLSMLYAVSPQLAVDCSVSTSPLCRVFLVPMVTRTTLAIVSLIVATYSLNMLILLSNWISSRWDYRVYASGFARRSTHLFILGRQIVPQDCDPNRSPYLDPWFHPSDCLERCCSSLRWSSRFWSRYRYLFINCPRLPG